MRQREPVESVARCGLVCGLCLPEETCRCDSNNHCGKRLSPDGCRQHDCSIEKGLRGCWECDAAPCGEDMHAPGKVKIRAFIRCLREDGPEAFAGYLRRNLERGVVYHRDGIRGDYDLDTEEAVLSLLRDGPPPIAPTPGDRRAETRRR